MVAKSILTIFLVVSLLSSQAVARIFTYPELVGKLTDMEALAQLPRDGERCAQFSSYDRMSVYDEAADQYINWFANGDSNGFIRTEGDNFVIAEMDGPGCIWHLWSADARNGHVKIYLDGGKTPAIDMPFVKYFDGENGPFQYSALVHHTAKGYNNYVPISYQKSCKIVAEPGWGAYYMIGYSTFPSDTVVPTFDLDMSFEDRMALKRADNYLADGLGSTPPSQKGSEKQTVSRIIELHPGDTVTVADIAGPAAISEFRIRPLNKEYSDKTYWTLAVAMYWDKEKGPSVWSPLADFFGTAHVKDGRYKSLPLGVTDKEFYSLWYMPFAIHGRIDISNDGKECFKAVVSVSYVEKEDLGDVGYFHAKWHRDAFLPQDKGRELDWTILTTDGTGRYCGVLLEVWNPVGGWWGEGDEKFFVDGEKFPSTFGTGSEDYFGYAWCTAERFQNAYHNQPYCDGANRGGISVNRWHIQNNIPFFRSFDGYIEKYFSNDRPTHYAAVAYWYLAPDGVDPYGPVSVEERTNWYPYVEPYRLKNGIEAEDMQIVSKSGGKVETQVMMWPYSADEQLWWVSAKPGDTLVLALEVKEPGRYQLQGRITKSFDYAKVQFYLNGLQLGSEMDLYNPWVMLTKDLPVIGEAYFNSGTHELAIEITGKNERSKDHYVGVDCFRLNKVK